MIYNSLEEVIEEFETIRNNELIFNDMDFPPKKESLWHSLNIKPEKALNFSKMRFKRVYNDELSIPEGCILMSEGDLTVKQNNLSCTWLLNALSMFTTAFDFFGEIFCNTFDDYLDIGAFVVNFFDQYGDMKFIAVDDNFPCYRNGGLVYSSTNVPGELWVSVIEKAFAKLASSYEHLRDGDIPFAIWTLSGLLTKVYNEKCNRDQLWADLNVAFKKKLPMGSICNKNDTRCVQFSDKPKMSHFRRFVLGRMYSIEELETDESGARFVHLYNPWMLLEDDEERVRLHYDDFCDVFTDHYVCIDPTDESEQVIRYDGEWAGRTAAGCHNNADWMANEKYGFTIGREAEVSFVLFNNTNEIREVNHCGDLDGVGAYIFAVDDMRKPIYTAKFKPAAVLAFSSFLPAGDYIIMPATFKAGVEGPFSLYINSCESSDLQTLVQEKKENITLHGEWSPGGGHSRCKNWYRNPQYMLTSKTKQDVTVSILSDIASGCHHGFYVMGVDGFMLSFDDDAKLHMSSFTTGHVVDHTLLGFSDSVVIVPTLYEEGEQGAFDISIECKDPSAIEFSLIEADVRVTEFDGEWSAQLSGSCQRPWDNPVYEVEAAPGTPASLMIEAGFGVGFYILKDTPVANAAEWKNRLVFQSKFVKGGTSLDFKFMGAHKTVEQRLVKYYVVPCQYQGGQAAAFHFSLRMHGFAPEMKLVEIDTSFEPEKRVRTETTRTFERKGGPRVGNKRMRDTHDIETVEFDAESVRAKVEETRKAEEASKKRRADAKKRMEAKKAERERKRAEKRRKEEIEAQERLARLQEIDDAKAAKKEAQKAIAVTPSMATGAVPTVAKEENKFEMPDDSFTLEERQNCQERFISNMQQRRIDISDLNLPPVEYFDPSNMDKYLPDDIFEQLLRMDRETFNNLKGWRKTSKKKDAGLF
ncbi:hypothetical protein PCE1_000313 [Barthelona sp. PCE]